MTAKQTPSTWPWLLAGDIAAAIVFLTVIELEIWVFEDNRLALGQQIFASVVAPAVALPLAFRSREPLLALVVNSLATFIMVTIGYASEFYQWPNLILLFTVSVYHRGLKSWLSLLGGLLGVAYYFVTLLPDEWDTGSVVIALWVVAWLTGRLYGSTREESRLRADRDLAAEVAATRQERLELEGQRTRMARELHDLIGHTVNVMVVHAGAGRRAVRTDPGGAARAFATIETTGHAALEELDRVLGVLRGDDPEAPMTPLPGLAEVDELVDHFTQAGLAIQVTRTGPVDKVPPGVGLTVYRIVQESLTNTLKHSGATEASVGIAVADDQVEVVTVDDGRRSATPPGDLMVAATTGRTGQGLKGIAERVRLHGGSVEFGPVSTSTPGSGFRVRCLLPLTVAEARP